MPHAVSDLPSQWLLRFAHLIPGQGRVLDLACGYGRNSLWLAGQGFKVVALDRDAEALRGLAGIQGIEAMSYDVEAGAWPFTAASFEAVVVTHYLHRPLLGHLFEALRPGGVLLYETFAVGNEQFGRPSNPNFLLKQSELLAVLPSKMEVVAFEQGIVYRPKPAVLQRLCAIAADGRCRDLEPGQGQIGLR